MVGFINEQRACYGGEPICRVLPIARASYDEERKRQEDPSLFPRLSRIDALLRKGILWVHERSDGTYGAKKVWKQLLLDGVSVARCTVERLMRKMGLCGVVRGRAFKVTTISNEGQPRPKDLVNRNFVADRPNQLWVADLTYVATWAGFVYVAFIVDVFSRKIVGWRVSTSLKTDLALDALEQALCARRPVAGLIQPNDAGIQYLSIRYSERLRQAGIHASVGSVGDSYDNRVAESINGLFKTEVIRRKGPWKNVDDVEIATLNWVDWFNKRRLLEPLGYLSPVVVEEVFYRRQEAQLKAA